MDRAPNQRFRHEQWAPHLAREHGISLDFAPFESPELSDLLAARGRRTRKLLLATRDFARRWTRRHEAERYDGVVVLREASVIGGAWIEGYIASRGIPLIYDFDDSIWLPRPDGGALITMFLRMPWKVARICKLASAVTVGNEYLAAFARHHNPNVSVVRTSVDIERFKVLPPRESATPFTIVWTGSRSTLKYLDLVRPALETLATRMPLKLRVICDQPPRPFERVALEFIPWSPAVEVSALAEGDVGIMPLPDTPTARGKCACKAIQYMAVGRPALVSPVGMNRQLVHHNENGLFAADLDAWVTQLERLAHDPALRRRLATAGRRTVESGYSATLSAQAFADVTRGVIGESVTPARRQTAVAG